MKKLALVLGIVLLVVIVSSCSTTIELSGLYEGTSPEGLPVSMDFKIDKVEANLLGLPVTGTYKVNGNKLTVVVTVLGQSQELVGRIDGDEIIFDDFALIKQRAKSTSFEDESSIETTNTRDGSLGITDPETARHEMPAFWLYYLSGNNGYNLELQRIDNTFEHQDIFKDANMYENGIVDGDYLYYTLDMQIRRTKMGSVTEELVRELY